MSLPAQNNNADEVDLILEGGQELPDSPVFSLPVTISVSVGRASITVEQMLALDPASIIELDSTIDEPVKLYVGEHLFAFGELIETESSTLGVRITEFGKNR